MRLPIAYEGRTTSDGRTIRRLEFDEGEPYPIMVALAGCSTVLLDVATVVRRIKNGIIVAEIPRPILGLGPGIDATDLRPVSEAVTYSTLDCRLRGITLSPHPAWPDLLFTPDTKEFPSDD